MTDRPTLAEVKDMIRNREYSFALFADEQNPLREDRVVFDPRGEVWAVYLTSERGWPIDTTHRAFDTESEALEYFVVKLEQTDRVLQLEAKRREPR